MRTSCRFHEGLPDGIHICHGKDDSYLGREVDSKECNKSCKTYERLTKDGTVARLKDIKKAVLRLGDPWTLKKRTRFWSDGTHTGDGKDLIECRDIVHDLYEFWTRGGNGKGRKK